MLGQDVSTQDTRLFNFLLILYTGYIWHVFETFLFPLQYLGVSFTVTRTIYVIYLKATQYSNTKIGNLFNYSYMEAYLSHLWFGLFFCFHIYCKNFPCGWVSPCTSSGKHIPGYYGTNLHSDSCKRALVTEFIKLYSRKTGVSDPRHWRNSLALPRTMWTEHISEILKHEAISLLITG